MGEAARTLVIANTEKAITGKRPQKRLKAVTHCTGNLIAFKPLQRAKRAEQPATKPAAQRENPTVVPAYPCALNS